MLRYCVNCRKDYDFSPLSVSGKAPLICPVCKNVIDKNSRHPTDNESAEKNEEKMGLFTLSVFRFMYIFYMIMGIAGVAGFVLKIDILLYAATAISVSVFIIQLLTGTLNFVSGLIFIPAGAVAGFLIFKSIRGACLGVHIVFLIRHLIRDVIFSLIFKLIRFGS